MTDDPRPAPGSDSSHAPGDRLESWKEIAAYLRRDVRTVQRWEQTDGLPIHRHKRAQRPIPYAYKSELDAWWTGRSESGAPPSSQTAPIETFRSRARVLSATAAVIAIAAALSVFWMSRSRASHSASAGDRTRDASIVSDSRSKPPPADPLPQKSIAVLPFLDLSEKMKNEEFADGMTEELIDRLNKIPGLRVPAPTSSFYFKGKQVPIVEIAQALHVAYVLDGSIRQSGARLRVAARLIRADNADVVWSETYDRPWDDMLIVQDDIAGEVTKALMASIDAKSDHDKSH